MLKRVSKLNRKPKKQRLAQRKMQNKLVVVRKNRKEQGRNGSDDSRMTITTPTTSIKLSVVYVVMH